MGRALAQIAEDMKSRKDPRVCHLQEFSTDPDWMRGVCADPAVLFVTFPDEQGWKIQAVPPTPGSFAQRQPLPEAWGGLAQAELAALTGVADVIFCHPGRFIMGVKSWRGRDALLAQILGGAR